jgi:ABC-type phosphate transport system substrate-binding protein
MSMMDRSHSVPLERARRTRRSVLLGALALASGASLGRATAHAEGIPDFRVVVHPDNPSTGLSREFVIDVFLKRVTRWSDGEMIRPVDQRVDSFVRRRFSESVLQRSVAAIKSYWQQRIFSGRELPPPEVDSDEAVVSYVLKHRGAVGYVSGAAKLDRAKAVQVQ